MKGERVIPIDFNDYKVILRFCMNPECPNFALLQVPLEEMPTKENQ